MESKHGAVSPVLQIYIYSHLKVKLHMHNADFQDWF